METSVIDASPARAHYKVACRCIPSCARRPLDHHGACPPAPSGPLRDALTNAPARPQAPLDVLLVLLGSVLLHAAGAAAQFTIDTPQNATRCVPTTFTWRGGAPEYTLVLSTTGGYVQWYADLTGDSFTWDTAVAPGPAVGLAVLVDARRSTASSQLFDIADNEDPSCHEVTVAQSSAVPVSPLLDSSTSKKLGGGAIAGIVVGVVAATAAVVVVAGALLRRRRRRRSLISASFRSACFARGTLTRAAAGIPVRGKRLSDKAPPRSGAHAVESPFADPKNPFDDPPPMTTFPPKILYAEA